MLLSIMFIYFYLFINDSIIIALHICLHRCYEKLIPFLLLRIDASS